LTKLERILPKQLKAWKELVECLSRAGFDPLDVYTKFLENQNARDHWKNYLQGEPPIPAIMQKSVDDAAQAEETMRKLMWERYGG
jgi:hypothetical protein